jgi:site-specific recombinase XerD
MFWAWYGEAGQPDLSANVLNRYKRFLQSDKHFSSKTIGVAISAVKKALEVCYRAVTLAERMDLMDMQAVKVKQIIGSGYSVCVPQNEVEKMFGIFNANGIADIRNISILSLLFYAGLRRGEVANLELRDYDRERGILSIREAKGNKNKAIPLHDLAVKNLNEWINVRYRWAGEKTNAIFTTSKGKNLDGRSIYWVVEGTCKKAGVKRYHPHDARSTFITRLHDAGVAIGDIQQLVGHASPATTMGYVRTDWEKLREAVRKLS